MSHTIWTYDILCHVHTTSYVHFRHTTLYTICGDENVRCRMWHVDTYDVVCWRTTSYVMYDVACTMLYVYILYIARTTSYVRCSTRCRMSHVRHRTCMTYDIVRDVRHRRWQESRWYRVHSESDIVCPHADIRGAPISSDSDAGMGPATHLAHRT